MGCMIIFVVLMVIGIGILCFLTGDMTAFFALVITLAIGFVLIGVLYHKFKPREKQVDTMNPLSPTLQWMNTAGSILLASNYSTDFRYLGGYGYRIQHEKRKRLQDALWKYWGIQGHESAVKEMRSLVTEGMRAQYRREMEALSQQYAGYSEEQLIEEARKGNPNANEDSYLPKMLMAYRRYGENALLGWDLGRCAYNIQWCYMAGYVNMQEMLDIGVEAGEKAQAFFQNWEEMMESYLLGGQFWQHEDKNDPKSMTAKRWKLYKQLWQGKKHCKISPYLSVPFDQPLSKEVITDEYGILPEYQKYYNHG